MGIYTAVHNFCTSQKALTAQNAPSNNTAYHNAGMLGHGVHKGGWFSTLPEHGRMALTLAAGI
jgi:hypothetical protein